MSEESFDPKQESPEEMDQESKMEMPKDSVARLFEREHTPMFVYKDERSSTTDVGVYSSDYYYAQDCLCIVGVILLHLP